MASVPSPAAAAALIRCQYSYGLLRTQRSVKTCPDLGTSRLLALFPGVPAFLRRRSVSAVWHGNRAPPRCGTARTLRLSWTTTSRSLGSGSTSWLLPLRFPHPVTMMAPRVGVESRFLREMEAMGTVLAAMEKAQEEIENEEANEKCLEDIRAAVHAAKAQLDGPTGHLLALLVDAELNALWTRCSQSRGSS